MTPIRPLIVEGGAHRLAGGWCRFDLVEVAGRRVAAETLDPEDLARLTAPRPDLVGLTLDRPRIMGIVNVTPDSFSDGGADASLGQTVDRALGLVAEGADILDIGGESTRPGAAEVPADQEIARTGPVIEALRARSSVPISIDTRKAAVARAALAAGADMVNDVSALRFDPNLAGVAAGARALCLMHSRATPETMQDAARYDDVMAEVASELSTAAAGAPNVPLILDPGIGFAKDQAQNLALLRHLAGLHALGRPLLVGASRKRFVGAISGVEAAGDRVHGSVAVALGAVAQGAQVLRVHDVAATRQALSLWMAIHG
ncbi:MAG: dihydropteroate synthase [Shimia sp.]